MGARSGRRAVQWVLLALGLVLMVAGSQAAASARQSLTCVSGGSVVGVVERVDPVYRTSREPYYQRYLVTYTHDGQAYELGTSARVDVGDVLRLDRAGGRLCRDEPGTVAALQTAHAAGFVTAGVLLVWLGVVRRPRLHTVPSG